MTGFASIPGWADRIVDRMGNSMDGAVVHDWLYAVGEPGKKSYADDVLRYALMEQHVDVVTRNAMYQAVGIGGGAAYGSPTEWSRRFGDPDTGTPVTAPPFKKRATAIVTRLDSCNALERDTTIRWLKRNFRSADWAK